MKKRKELNALIGLAGDGRRKKPNKGSGHRLLRTEPPASDSQSSSQDHDDDDDEEFGPGDARPRFPKGDYARCCKVCYPLCAFVILAACVVACVGLVWMQVALKDDLDALKEKFHAMESSQKSSFQEIPKLSEDLLNKQKELERLESGDLGLSRVWGNVSAVNKQIALLTSAVNHLKANIKSASDLIGLPATVEGLQKSVASIGSTLDSVHLAAEAMQETLDAHSRAVEALQDRVNLLLTKEANGSRPDSSPSENQNDSLKQDLQHLHSSLEEVNSTLARLQSQNGPHLLGLDGAIGNLSRRVSVLEDGVAALSKPGGSANRSAGGVGDPTSLVPVQIQGPADNETAAGAGRGEERADRAGAQGSKLRETLQLMTALTGQPEGSETPEPAGPGGDGSGAPARPPAPPQPSPRSPADQREAGASRTQLSLPGVSNTEDLLALFGQAGPGADGKLSPQDIRAALGPAAPEAAGLAPFDADGDGKYTLAELRLATGL
ncbi:EF-hand calcium-binding domain-containing protein 14 [Tachyglossus aculeatus]|uniref:EF-hand calcium-binding domain-containing protein 14 n=1 Tax=Tachyglossus aculeatus TaxID=9261 RepID=UPI0018F38208|nr:EF-hand calcium-binding domain-containing protein 14 [Tachyglossus aculeatus]